PAHADFFLPCQSVATDEVAFVQFANPTEVRFQQRCVFIDLVTIKRQAGFEAKCIASSETAGKHSGIAAVVAGIKHLVPNLFGLVGGGVHFKSVFARITGTRDDRGYAVNPAFGEVVVLNVSERQVGEFLKNTDSVRAL